MAPSDEELIAGTQSSDVLVGSMIYNTTLSSQVFDSSANLRLVAKYSIGCEDVDVEAATERGILVTYGPTESNWGGVAEGTLTNMLVLFKKVRERDTYLKSGGAWRDPSLQGTYVGARSSDGYAGIDHRHRRPGSGRTRVADLLRPWNARVLACDPYLQDSHFAAHGVQRVDLPTLLAESDVVTLHVS